MSYAPLFVFNRLQMLLKLQPPQGLHYSFLPSMPLRHGAFVSQDIFSKSAQQQVPNLKFGDDVTTFIDNPDIYDDHLFHTRLKALTQLASSNGGFFELVSNKIPLPEGIKGLGAGLSGTAFELPKTDIGTVYTAAIAKVYHGPNEVQQSREALTEASSISTPMSHAMLDKILEYIKESADKEETALKALNTNINVLSSVIRKEEEENSSQNRKRLDKLVEKIIQNGYNYFPRLYGRGLLQPSAQASQIYEFLLLQKVEGEPFDFFDRERHKTIAPERLLKATNAKGLQAQLTTMRALDVLGIIHGDLKPANILWQKNEKETFEGPVGIIDFGNSALFDVFKPSKAQDNLNVPSFVRPTNLFSFEVKYLFPILSQLLAIQDNRNHISTISRQHALEYISDYFKAERDYLMREELRLPSVINNGQYTESQQQKYAEIRNFDKLRLFAFEDFAIRRNPRPTEATKKGLLNQLSPPFSRLELMRIQMMYADTMATVYKGQPDGERAFRDWSLMALMNTLEYLFYCQPASNTEIDPKGDIKFALSSDEKLDRKVIRGKLLSNEISTDDIYVEVSPSDSKYSSERLKEDFNELYYRKMYDWGIHWLEKLLTWDIAAGMHLPLQGSRMATCDLKSIVDNLSTKEDLELSEFKGTITHNRKNLDSTLRSLAEAMLKANIKPDDSFLSNQTIPVISKENRTPDRIMRRPLNIVDTLLETDNKIVGFRSRLLPKL